MAGFLIAAAISVAALGVSLSLHKRNRELRNELSTLAEELELARARAESHRKRFDQYERIAKIGTWSSDFAAGVLHASDHYLEIYGVTLDEMPYEPEDYIETFIEDESERRSAQENIERLRRGEPIEGTRKIRLKSGERKTIFIRSEPRYNRDGVLLGYDGVVRDITVEHQREAELARATMLLREVHNIAKIGHFYWELASDKLSVSDDYYATFGLSPGEEVETMAEWVEKICHPDDRGDIEETFRRISKGEPYDVIRRTRAADGSERFVEIHAVPVLDEGGKAHAYRGTVRDVTEQQENLQRLADSQERLKASEADLLRAQRLAQIGSWKLDLGTGLMEYSAEYMRLFDLTPETAPRTADEWVARFIEDADEAARVRARFDGAVESGESYSGIRSIRRGDGSRRWISFAADPVLDASGKAIAFVGAMRDMTEEYVAREALAASEERYRMISENMQDIVTLHDPAGKLIYASPSLYRRLGHLPNKSAGSLPYDYLHPDDVVSVKQAVAQLALNETSSAKIEYRIRKRGGQYTWVETNFVRVEKNDQSLSHFQAVTRDISERKEAEKALERRTDELSLTNRLLVEEATRRHALERRVLLSIERALGQVGLELHDDLGQQLTGISLLAKTLEHKLSSSSLPRDLEIAAEAARISGLVNRAINHTRMISHGLSPYIGGEFGLPAALSQLANDIDSIGVVACVAEVDSHLSVRDEVVARSLYRIAQEAANNSLKHSGASLIRISLKRVGSFLQLTIGDDGDKDVSEREQTLAGNQLLPSLYSIRHRAQSIGARVAFRHFAGRGTFVCIRWETTERPQQPTAVRIEKYGKAA